MSALDNVNPVQFYHGTRAKLKVGGYVDPGRKTNFPDVFPGGTSVDEGGDPVVYATNNRDTAAHFAEQSRGKGPATVYSVEPDYPEDMMRDPEDEANERAGVPSQPGRSYMSNNPLRVTGKMK